MAILPRQEVIISDFGDGRTQNFCDQIDLLRDDRTNECLALSKIWNIERKVQY